MAKKTFTWDPHVHSRFANACSPYLTIKKMSEWAKKKGVHVLGTGDALFPKWQREIERELVKAPETGLFVRRREKGKKGATRFMLTCEVASIWRPEGEQYARKVHLLVAFPTLGMFKKFGRRLEPQKNLRVDGRPMIRNSAAGVVSHAMAVSPKAIVIPAHIWTPWFGIFGSKSGFDSLEECFGRTVRHIYAVETGMSSDPPMNWRLSDLDTVSLISSSDAHSLQNIGREATLFSGKMSYPGILSALKYGAPKRRATKRVATKLEGTVEFYPEEGKYHHDGHRKCGVSLTPGQRKRAKGKCKVCKKPVTVGVLSRVEELADKPAGRRPRGAKSYHSLVPLRELIAEAEGVGVKSRTADIYYEELIEELGGELDILMNATKKSVADASTKEIADAVYRARKGKVSVTPGYDGKYGEVALS